MAAIVVKARFSYGRAGRKDEWHVSEDDLGVLRWRRHRQHSAFLEPLVIWDRDPDKRPRSVVMSSLEIVGLQSRKLRVMIARQ